MQVRFTAEGGVDHGGPRREFFRLVGNRAKDVFLEGRNSLGRMYLLSRLLLVCAGEVIVRWFIL